jgi:hypothetical protein
MSQALIISVSSRYHVKITGPSVPVEVVWSIEVRRRLP